MKRHLNKEYIQTLTEEISSLADEAVAGTKIRSRAKWIDDGERPTRYFFNLEKQKAKTHRITKLTNASGDNIENNLDLLNHMEQYYQELYSSQHTDPEEQQWLIEQLELTVTDDEHEKCEGRITAEEVTNAIGKANSNKSPGNDGLPAEFYKGFSEALTPLLVSVFNRNYDRGQMSTSQQQARVKLLFKKGDKQLLKNWRPISLLNTDYKLLSSILANRLRSTLPTTRRADCRDEASTRTLSV